MPNKKKNKANNKKDSMKKNKKSKTYPKIKGPKNKNRIIIKIKNNINLNTSKKITKRKN